MTSLSGDDFSPLLTNPTTTRSKPDDLSDTEASAAPYKRPRTSSSEYRKDREEWTDAAIEKLLGAYTEKFLGLNRGNLRGRDWEEVAEAVGREKVEGGKSVEQCKNKVDNLKKRGNLRGRDWEEVAEAVGRDKVEGGKSVEQCKNKVDNLKKRFKLERHRISNGGVAVTHWPWFKKMEVVVGNGSGKAAAGSGEDDKAVTVSSSSVSVKQSKRYGGAVALSPGVQINNNLKSKTQTTPRWRRVVFKISGAALAGTSPHNIDPKVAMLIATEVSAACRLGVEVAIVIGGRNFFCGDTWVTATGLDRCTAYQIGMMATVMNSILIQSALEKMGIQTRVQTAFAMPEVAEPYCRQKAIRHLEKGRVVIFGGIGAGTGNPLFSTDTAAALRASEIHADAVLKGTNIDGVYLCDSRNNNVISEHISFRELASRGASPMDVMAVTYCEENGIPVLIFNLHEPGNISRALCGEEVGTLIDQTGRVS